MKEMRFFYILDTELYLSKIRIKFYLNNEELLSSQIGNQQSRHQTE